MLKFQNPLNRLLFSFGTGCLGFFIGAIVNIIPLWILLMIASLGILAIVIAFLNEMSCPPRLFKRIVTSLIIVLTILIWGIPYGLSIERTIFIADSHAQHWGHPDLKMLVFPNGSIHKEKFIEGRTYLLTPIIGHRKPKHVLLPSELILDIDERITVSPPEIWRPLDDAPKGYCRFWYELPEVRFGFPKGPNEMLKLTVPSAEHYSFHWHLKGSEITPIDRSFKVHFVPLTE